jgi:hypothetical protein
MPGIAVNSAGQTAIALLMGSSTVYLGSGWTTKSDSSPTYGQVSPIASGNCSRQIKQYPAAELVGDYAGAQTNPNDLTSFWLAAERSFKSSLTNQACVWATDIIQVTP